MYLVPQTRLTSVQSGSRYTNTACTYHIYVVAQEAREPTSKGDRTVHSCHSHTIVKQLVGATVMTVISDDMMLTSDIFRPSARGTPFGSPKTCDIDRDRLKSALPLAASRAS